MLNRTDLEVLFNRAVSSAIQDAVGSFYVSPEGKSLSPTAIDLSIIQQDKIIPTLSAYRDPANPESSKDFKRIAGKVIGMAGTLVSGITMKAPATKISANTFYPRWFIKVKFPEYASGGIYPENDYVKYVTDIGVNLTDLFYGSPLLGTLLSAANSPVASDAYFKVFAPFSEWIRSGIIQQLKFNKTTPIVGLQEILQKIQSVFVVGTYNGREDAQAPSGVRQMMFADFGRMIDENTNGIADHLVFSFDRLNSIVTNFPETTFTLDYRIDSDNETTVGNCTRGPNLVFSTFSGLNQTRVGLIHGQTGDQATSTSQLCSEIENVTYFTSGFKTMDMARDELNTSASILGYMEATQIPSVNNIAYSASYFDPSFKQGGIGIRDIGVFDLAVLDTTVPKLDEFTVKQLVNRRYRLSDWRHPIFIQKATEKGDVAVVKTAHVIQKLELSFNIEATQWVLLQTDYSPTKRLYCRQGGTTEYIEPSSLTNPQTVVFSLYNFKVEKGTLLATFLRGAAYSSLTQDAKIIDLRIGGGDTTSTKIITTLVMKASDSTKILTLNETVRKNLLTQIKKDLLDQSQIPGISPIDNQVIIIDEAPDRIFRPDDNATGDKLVHTDGLVMINERLEHDIPAVESGTHAALGEVFFQNASADISEDQIKAIVSKWSADDIFNLTHIGGFCSSYKGVPSELAWRRVQKVQELLSTVATKEFVTLRNKYKVLGGSGFTNIDSYDVQNSRTPALVWGASGDIEYTSMTPYVFTFNPLGSDLNSITLMSYSGLNQLSYVNELADSTRSNRAEIWRAGTSNLSGSNKVDTLQLAVKYGFVKYPGYIGKTEMMSKCLPFVAAVAEPGEDPDNGITYSVVQRMATNPKGYERLDVIYSIAPVSTVVTSNSIMLNPNTTGIMLDIGKFTLPTEMYRAMHKYLHMRTDQTRQLLNELLTSVSSIFKNDTLWAELDSATPSVVRGFDLDRCIASWMNQITVPFQVRKPFFMANIVPFCVNQQQVIDRTSIRNNTVAYGYDPTKLKYDWLYQLASIAGAGSHIDLSEWLYCMRNAGFMIPDDPDGTVLYPGMLHSIFAKPSPIIDEVVVAKGPDGITTRLLSVTGSLGISEIYRMHATTMIVKSGEKILTIDEAFAENVALERIKDKVLPDVPASAVPPVNPNTDPSAVAIPTLAAIDVEKPEIRINADTLQFGATYRVKVRASLTDAVMQPPTANPI